MKNNIIVANENIVENNNLKVLEDSKIVVFSRFNKNYNYDIEVSENVNLKLDFILMDSSNINVNININGENSDVTVRVLSLAKNATKKISEHITHYTKHSKSTIENYGISFVDGHNEFDCVGDIKENMTGSDVRQITKGLILSDTGSCKALPILLISHHDVKAYHGATIGKINDEDLFYLMSRGLTKENATMLVIKGILEPFLTGIEDDDTKSLIMDTYMSYFN